jgi:hypothetical protein
MDGRTDRPSHPTIFIFFQMSNPNKENETMTEPPVDDVDSPCEDHDNHHDNSNDYESSRKRRRNLGRSARRRRKKILEVEALANSNSAAIAEEPSLTVPLNKNNILAKDRQHVWPSVQILRQLDASDEQSLLNQLGYLPGNALQAAARADAIPGLDPNHPTAPVVLQLYPIVVRDETDGKRRHHKPRVRKQQQQQQQRPSINGEETTCSSTTVDDTRHHLLEPFPTIYWVTHPRLRALISKLELDQVGVALEKKLKEDLVAMEQMKRAHLLYGQERQALLQESDWEWIRQRNWQDAFGENRGVAGIRNPASVKCLHAHAAHYWSGCEENVIGKWVAEYVLQLISDVASTTTIKSTTDVATNNSTTK